MPTPLTDKWIEEQLAICKAEADYRVAISGIPRPGQYGPFNQMYSAACEGYPIALKEIQRLRKQLEGCPGLCAWSEEIDASPTD